MPAQGNHAIQCEGMVLIEGPSSQYSGAKLEQKRIHADPIVERQKPTFPRWVPCTNSQKPSNEPRIPRPDIQNSPLGGRCERRTTQQRCLSVMAILVQDTGPAGANWQPQLGACAFGRESLYSTH